MQAIAKSPGPMSPELGFQNERFCHPYLNNGFPVQERGVVFEILAGGEEVSGAQSEEYGSLLERYKNGFWHLGVVWG